MSTLLPQGVSDYPWKRFESETKAIINKLVEGTGKYVSTNDLQQIKAELEKTIFELLDQRFRVIQEMVNVAIGVTSINDIAQKWYITCKTCA